MIAHAYAPNERPQREYPNGPSRPKPSCRRPSSPRTSHLRIVTHEDEVRESELNSRRLTTLFLACALVVFLALTCAFAYSSEQSRRVRLHLDSCETKTVHVLPGDTLWVIAERCGSGDVIPTYDVVSWIRARNGLSSSSLRAGQLLSVPLILD